MREIFSKVSYQDEELLDSNIDLMEIEYFKILKKDKNEYDIEINKREVSNQQEILENKYIKNVCNNETMVNKLLAILSKNKVTPIASEDVICDFLSENGNAL